MEASRNWKQKAISRRLQNKELGKRIKELKASRGNWKQKHHRQKQRADQLGKELVSLKKKLYQLL